MKSLNKPGLFVLATVLVVGVWMVYQPSEPQPAARSAPTLRDKSERAQAHIAARTPQNDETVNPNAAPDTPGDRIARLSLSNRPGDKFNAYRLVRQCLDARDVAVMRAEAPPKDREAFPDAAKACQGVSATQIVSRIELLKAAAAAGVHGASNAFTQEGPDGMGIDAASDLTTAPAIEWHRLSMQYIEKGAATGDPGSLTALANQYQNGVPAVGDVPGREMDKAKALMYWIAGRERSLIETSRPEQPHDVALIQQMSKGLTPAQAAQSVLAGKQLAHHAQPVQGEMQ